MSRRDVFDAHQSLRLEELGTDVAELKGSLSVLRMATRAIREHQLSVLEEQKYLAGLRNSVFSMGQMVEAVTSLADPAVQYLWLRLNHARIKQDLHIAMDEFNDFEDKEYAKSINSRLTGLAKGVDQRIDPKDKEHCYRIVDRKHKIHNTIIRKQEEIRQLESKGLALEKQGPKGSLIGLVLGIVASLLLGIMFLSLGSSTAQKAAGAVFMSSALTMLVATIYVGAQQRKSRLRSLDETKAQIAQCEHQVVEAKKDLSRFRGEELAQFADDHPEYAQVKAYIDD